MSLEVVILFPALLLVITAMVQYGLWFHARSLALAAAQEGVTAARVFTAGPTAGVERAQQFVADHGADTLLEPVVTATAPAAGLVSVSVSGRALSVLPGLPGIVVAQSASGPVERFTSAGDP